MTPAEANELFSRALVVHVRAKNEVRGLDAERWRKLRDAVFRHIADWNAEHKDVAGIRLNELRQGLDSSVSAILLQAALDALVHNGEIRQSGPTYHLPGFRPGLSEETLSLWKTAEEKLRSHGVHPPTAEELARSCDMEIEQTRDLLKQAENMKLVVQLEPKRFFLPETLRQLAHKLADLAISSTDGRVTTAAYRDEAGLGRNLTISVLEHFDAIHLTRRVGNSRCLIKSVEVVFETDDRVDRID
jgi:selenocysteine-specific elongation factor